MSRQKQSSTQSSTRGRPLYPERVLNLSLVMAVCRAVRIACVLFQRSKFGRAALDRVHAREVKRLELRVERIDELAVGIDVLRKCIVGEKLGCYLHIAESVDKVEFLNIRRLQLGVQGKGS
jgi:hypothetical protein